LVRHHIGGFLLGRGDVAVGPEIAAGEFRFQLDAFIIALRVIERAQNQRLAKISVVEQVGRDLVLGVDPDFESAAVARIAYSLGRSIIGTVADGAWLDDRAIFDLCLFAADREAGANYIGRVDLE
jgi:hypothetical protein